MNFLSDPLFLAIFNTPLPRIIVKNDAPNFTVIASNDAQQQISYSIGRKAPLEYVWEAFGFERKEDGAGLLLMNAIISAVADNNVVLTPAFKNQTYSTSHDQQNDWCVIEVKPVTTNNSRKVEYLLLTTHYLNKQFKEKSLVQSQWQEQELNKRLAILNEELAASNGDLIASNAELMRSQMELKALNDNLEQRVLQRTQALAESETRFRNLVQQAPVAIIVLSGPDMIVELANDKMLQLWNKTTAVIGKPLLKTRPEIHKHQVFKLFKRVYTSGKAFTGYEIKGTVERNGKMVKGYYDAIYQPIKNSDGKVTGLMAVITDVTEQVIARRELDSAYEQTRLAKQAAQLGMFDMNLLEGTMEWDERCRILFGISHNRPVTYERDFWEGLHPNDKERVGRIIEAAFNKLLSGGEYDVEYRTIGAEDKKERWVRAKGKVFFDEQDTPVRFIGSVLEITEQKKEEQRKSDFIGIVSHELKTPLTSVKAYIQLLKHKAALHTDPFNEALLSKAEKQVNKMTAMVKSFLDVSRLESGKIHIEKEDFIINSLLEEVIADAIALTPGHTIIFKPCRPIWVCADREKISHVIHNILNNAIKYSPGDSTIKVECNLVKNMAEVSIADEGMGIAKDDLDKLFDRYYRVQNPHMKMISGFGIGLYLSAEIIKRHEGKIWAESEEGKGAVFYFSLPGKCD